LAIHINPPDSWLTLSQCDGTFRETDRNSEGQQDPKAIFNSPQGEDSRVTTTHYHYSALFVLLRRVVTGSTNVVASTSDWPQWRGPEPNGISQERGLLKQWPAGGPKPLWQLNDIRDGFSGPSVVGTRIYLMSNRGIDNEFVQALQPRMEKSSGPRAS